MRAPSEPGAERFDYIIIGAGSAGAVLAARLSEDGSVRVLLLEAGGTHKHWSVDMPLAVGRVLEDPKRTWQFFTEPEPHLEGRRIEQPRGRILGGTSSINGMVYSRGHPLDYDDWAEEFGCSGWSFAEVLPYFIRSERAEGASSEYRGGAGPLPVTIPRLSENALNLAFVDSGRAAGYPITADANGYQQEGFGANERTIAGGRRFSTARAFLDAAAARKNLVVRQHSIACRILFAEKRAVGVVYRHAGQERHATCGREVIVCAGAFGSPQLLMVSGIGPATTLRSVGVRVIYDLPPVGGNLHDHPEVLVQNWCETQVSLYRASKGWRQLATGLKWFAAKRGLAASSQFHAAAFIRTGAGVLRPDVKLELFPLAYGPDLKPLTGDAYQIHVGLMRPSSRGSLSIRSADPSESPSIRFNFLEHPADTLALTRAIRLVREILAQAPIARFTGAEISPGRDVQTDEQIFRWMRRTLRGAYHPVGTCRMGAANDPDAVVDPRLRVRGVEALRVVDASVMPRITTGNTNAPTIMIAEKAADMILSRSAPPKIPAPFWTNPDWKTRQR